MLAEFSVIPIGAGESLGEHVATIMRLVEKSGLPYRANAMGTVVEGDWEAISALIKRCNDETLKTAPRVVTSIRLDIRPGKPADRLTEKLKSVERRLGHEVKK